jgi:hypothetical protein
VGDVDVPWFGPMNENHPLIGLAMYREENGRLEMIGKNWIKHGFFALSQSACDPCPTSGDGTYLLVDCSDTYSSGNNGNRYYLGPRDEIDPYTGDWSACGSWFDEPDTPDADCERDYFGDEPNPVNHRLEVDHADLDRPDATFYYEGIYVVRNDDDRTNNIGWRELSLVSWNGSTWSFQDYSEDPLEPKVPNPGPLVLTWGDAQDVAAVPGDGDVMLAVRVTDLGDGWWHYDYALYNRDSARGLRSLDVPVGSALTRNFEFRDIDDDPANDWAIPGGLGGQVPVSFFTDDWATNPDANALEYQTLFNCRFESDEPPVPGSVMAGIFRPGTGSHVELAALVPAGATGVPGVAAGAAGLSLAISGANPFADGTVVRWSQARPGPARVAVIDVAGRAVRTLRRGLAPAGAGTVRWDGRDAAGSPVASGVYFVRLETDEGARTVRVVRRR